MVIVYLHHLNEFANTRKLAQYGCRPFARTYPLAVSISSWATYYGALSVTAPTIGFGRFENSGSYLRLLIDSSSIRLLVYSTDSNEFLEVAATRPGRT